MPIVEMPNGDQVEFPDDMPKDEIKGLIASKFPEFAASQEQAAPETEELQEYEKMSASENFVGQGLMMGAGDEIAAAIATPGRMVKQFMNDEPVSISDAYDQEHDYQTQRLENYRDENPITSTATEIGGALMGGGAGIKAATKILPKAAKKFAPYVAGVTGAGVHGFNSTDGDFGERLEGGRNSAIVAGITGVAAPLIIKGGTAGVRATKNAIKSTAKPEKVAAERVQKALDADKGSTILKEGDELVAKQNDQVLMNVDRGGENTRALARSASNMSPDARATMTRNSGDRFLGQSDRAVKFVEGLAGEVDDLALERNMRLNSRILNSDAYKKSDAFKFGAEYPETLIDISKRIPPEAFKDAIKIAKAEGGKINGKFFGSFDKGNASFKLNGLPTFKEWDLIQRGLRNAAKSEKGAVSNSYGGLHKELLETLDAVNPDFKSARAGAAAAFGVDNSLDAGRVFARQTRNVPELNQAFNKMTGPEKKAFKSGYASEIIDRIKSAGDNTNVIKSVFEKPEAREKIELVFGKAKAKELEAFTRVETAMDAIRGALGNSTTTRQLVELGLVSGSNAGAGLYGLYSGDYRYALLTGALTGARYVKGRNEDVIMKKVAELLASEDPKAMQHLMHNAQANPKWMAGLKKATEAVINFKNSSQNVASAISDVKNIGIAGSAIAGGVAASE